MATVRTYQPKKRHRSKEHGFRKRMANPKGRKGLVPRRGAARFLPAVVRRAEQSCLRKTQAMAAYTAVQ
ncbi:50S ribosomal protein L34 [Firmicutes bacterium CAG:170]|nr:50S ribosomal protein L34 [Firmicutes bacterium CAG:170]